MNQARKLSKKKKKICMIYVPAWARSYHTKALKKILKFLKKIKRAGFTGIYLISLWKDGDYDNGFDVVDYVTNPRFTQKAGDLELLEIVSKAHSLGLTVGADVVPNHVSDKHILAQNCLSGKPGFEDVLYVVTEDKAQELTRRGVPSIFGNEAYSEVEGFEGQNKFVRNSFCDGHQLNLNWDSTVVKNYFKDLFQRFRSYFGFDFMRVDCGMLLHEDISRAEPGNLLACINPVKSVKAIREVAGNMPLFFEWFPSIFSLEAFKDDPLSFALACPFFAEGKHPKEWEHPQLVPFFGGHDQMPYYNRAKIEGFNAKAVRAHADEAPCEYIFTDLQTEDGYMLSDKELETQPGDYQFDATPDNPNKRYAARRPIKKYLRWRRRIHFLYLFFEYYD